MQIKTKTLFSIIAPVLLLLIAFIFSNNEIKSEASTKIINDDEILSPNIHEIDFELNYEIPQFTSSEPEFKVQNKLKKLRENLGNDDIVGHLKIAGSTIDYPVLQKDDNEYYLNRDINGNRTIAGSIFLDYENNVARQDRNMVIYGHNMNKDYMFHSIRYFNDWDYFQNHKYITFDTIYGNQTFEVFAFYKTDISFDYIKTFFEDDDEFLDLVKEIKNKSVFDTGVEISANDRILTLSTCSNQEQSTRFVVTAKLIDYVHYTAIN